MHTDAPMDDTRRARGSLPIARLGCLIPSVVFIDRQRMQMQMQIQTCRESLSLVGVTSVSPGDEIRCQKQSDI
jgi:hypothetical protein